MISIVIPTCNRSSIFLETFQNAFRAIQNVSAEIIIVNDSKTQKVDLPFLSERVTLYNNPSSGAASARNLGASKAKGNLLLFLDDDILISEKNIKDVLSFNQNYPDSCLNFNWKFPDFVQNNLHKSQFGRFLISTNLVNYKGWVHHSNWNDHELFEVERLAAFFFLIPKKIFELTGGFDESFDKQGVEDDEFSFRIKKYGYRLFIDPTKFVFHNEADKLTLRKRLDRLQRGAYNKRQAFEMGMQEYHIPYSFPKIVFYSFLSFLKPVIFFCIKSIPNHSCFDFLYKFSSHVLIGIIIFNGYYRRKTE